MPDQANLFFIIMLSICGSAPIVNAILLSLIKPPLFGWKLLLRAVPWIAYVISWVLFIYGAFAFHSKLFIFLGLGTIIFTTVFMMLSQAMGEKVRDGESPLS